MPGSRLIVFSLFIFLSKILLSQDIAGGEILGNINSANRLDIQLNLYSGCYSQHPGNAKLYVRCKGSGMILDSLLLSMNAPTDISGLCPSQCTHCSNLNCSFPLGFRKYSYQANIPVDSFSGCQELIVFYKQKKRFSSINTGPASSDFYLESRFSLQANNSNIKPEFKHTPKFIVCRNQDFYENISLVDMNLDSVVYDFTSPQINATQSVQYSGAYSFDKPLTFWGFPNASLSYPRGFHLDPGTGDLFFRPLQSEQTPLGVKATIFKNGQFIAEITREWLLDVNNCYANFSPNISGPYYKEICSDNSETLTISATDFDVSDSLLFINQSNMGYQVISQDYSNPNNPKQNIEFIVNYEDVNNTPKIFTFSVKDQKCPVPGSQTRAFEIAIKKGVRAFVQVADSSCGKYHFSLYNIVGDLATVKWTGDGGIASSDTAFMHQFYGEDTFYYSVELRATNGCKYYFADKIITSITAPYVYAGIDDTICYKGDSMELVGSPFPDQGVWSGEGIFEDNGRWFFDPNSPNLHKNKFYDFIYSYKAPDGCSNSDTLQLYLLETPQPHAGSIEPLCENDIPILLKGNPANGSWHGEGVNNNTFDPSVGSGLHSLVYEVTTNGRCPAYDTLIMKVDPVPKVNFSASPINGNIPLAVSFTDSSVIESGDIRSYHWNFGDGDTSYQFGSVDHTYTSPGLFSVILICESDKGCGDFKLKPNLVNPWPVSIHDNIKNSLRVFPNPTSDNLIIYSEESVMDKIQLLDVMGKIHYSRDDLFVNKYEIENKGLKGTYFLKVEFSTAVSMIIAVVFY